MRYFIALFLVFLSTTFELPLIAGGLTGTGGGGTVTFERNPWFLGVKPVSYCINSGKDFSGGKLAKEIIQQALYDWASTITALEPDEEALLSGTKSDDSDFAPHSNERRVQMKLQTKFFEVSCDKDPELIFALGIRNAVISNILTKYPQHVVGFAEQTYYDIETRRAKGIIWLTEDLGANRYRSISGQSGPLNLFWQDRDTLYSAMTHELGHVFGFSHEHNGIMWSKLPSTIIEAARDDIDEETKTWVRKLKNIHPSDYFTSNWLRSGKKVCGSLDASQQRRLRDLLKVPNTNFSAICFIRGKGPVEDDHGISDFKLNIELSTSTQLVVSKFEVKTPIFLASMMKQSDVPLSAYFVGTNSYGRYAHVHKFLHTNYFQKIIGFLEPSTGTMITFQNETNGQATLAVQKGNHFERVHLGQLK
jgi:hypothetical protein